MFPAAEAGLGERQRAGAPCGQDSLWLGFLVAGLLAAVLGPSALLAVSQRESPGGGRIGTAAAWHGSGCRVVPELGYAVAGVRWWVAAEPGDTLGSAAPGPAVGGCVPAQLATSFCLPGPNTSSRP